MFVGLQGAGKTTTCTKLAYYYKKKVSHHYFEFLSLNVNILLIELENLSYLC